MQQDANKDHVSSLQDVVDPHTTLCKIVSKSLYCVASFTLPMPDSVNDGSVNNRFKDHIIGGIHLKIKNCYTKCMQHESLPFSPLFTLGYETVL